MQIFFDLTSTARWAGPPVGIIRVERELARWTQRNASHVKFVFFDPIDGCFRVIRPEFVRPLLFDESVALWDVPRAGKPRLKRFSEWFMRILRIRRQLLISLERLRRRAKVEAMKARVAGLQERLLTARDRRFFFTAAGERRTLYSYREIIGERVRPGRLKTIICAGSGWTIHDIEALHAMRRRGTKFNLLCYDLIPIQYPEFYSVKDHRAFIRYFEFMFRHANRICFTASRIKQDAIEWHRKPSVALRKAAIFPLGASRRQRAERRLALPEPLVPGNYALYVSTIEPRKGHALIVDIWERLLAEGIPQKEGFRIVFVGRRGWKMDGFFERLERLQKDGWLLHFENAGDELLDTLYEHAAFCLFPSAYEGYGLSVVESFFHGKPIMASDGGALPEVVGDYSPCLPVGDMEKWHALLRRWIEDPTAYSGYAERLKTAYSHPDWDEAAALLSNFLIGNGLADKETNVAKESTDHRRVRSGRFLPREVAAPKRL